MVAADALLPVSICSLKRNREDYMEPSASSSAAEILVRGFICKSFTRKIGMVPKVISAAALSAPCA